MNDFLTVWQSGTALEAPEAIALVRRFTLRCVEAFLGEALDDGLWSSIERRALGRYLDENGRFQFRIGTPRVEADRFVIYFKAYNNERFGRYERVMLFRDNQGPVGLAVRIPLETQDGVHFAPGPIFVGLLWWGADPGDERSRAQAALAGAWDEEPTWFAREQCGERAILGRRFQSAEWTGDEHDLINEIAGLLTACAPMLDQLLPVPAENDAVRSLHVRLLRRGYRFSPEQVATFYAALKAKGFVILSGLSGTGKTKLAQEFAAALGLDDDHFLLEPVKPDWRDNTGLMGYWNPVTGEYVATRFLRFLLAAAEEYGSAKAPVRPYIVVLDEMNLARVEYYLADVLSVLESGRREDGFTRGEIFLHGQTGDVTAAGGLRVPPTLRLPPNLYIVGTVNVDETTFAFSPKVLDRAFTIEVKEVDLTDYPSAVEPPPSEVDGVDEALLADFTRQGRFAQITKADVAAWGRGRREYVDRLDELNQALLPHDLGFGYRVVDEILAFMAALRESPLRDALTEDEAFDTGVMMKVLPKFHGPLHRVKAPLEAVMDWAGDRFERTHAKAAQMLEQAKTAGHTRFS